MRDESLVRERGDALLCESRLNAARRSGGPSDGRPEALRERPLEAVCLAGRCKATARPFSARFSIAPRAARYLLDEPCSVLPEPLRYGA